MLIKKALIPIILSSGIFILFLCSCPREINSISDPHFDVDGTPLDTVEFFVPKRPSSAKLYIETSGSMNGFFRANNTNKFKQTVWSVFSGLTGLADHKVYTMSEGGDINAPISLGNFRTTMNGGGFVSNTETHIPMMLANIIANIDTSQNEIAVLVSDMKYSPMGKTAAPQIDQYQDVIRNITASHPYSVSFICAKSEYLDSKGNMVETESPYFYIIIGKSDNVAAIRNDITTWVKDKNVYVESGDLAMNYKTPSYSIEKVLDGGLKHSIYSNNVITSMTGDTCSFILRVNMEGYPERQSLEILDSCLNVNTNYGSTIKKEILNIYENPHENRQFERKAYADYLIKVYDIPWEGEVVDFTFNNNFIDTLFSPEFLNMLSATNENDLWGAFSFDRFIAGHYNGRLNNFDLEPGKESVFEPKHYRILITKNNE